ncbi:MAG: cohesin domain-containing protein, partial [Candidatus Doudnabacteria bacterium]|nr:cohesin domain-containing protein [Candidatus Doudnabacteria bacterium]
MKKILLAVFSAILLLAATSAEASTMALNPGSGSFALGATFKVTILIDTQGDAVNTGEASVTYSNNLELVSVNQGSTFYLPSLNSPSKGTTTAYFAGGLPTPGYSGRQGSLGIMVFRGKALGTATVTITRGKALLNDGNGTNSLTLPTSGITAKFNIVPPPLSAPVISSTTHPDQNAWYAQDDVDLSWDRPEGAYGFSA